MIGPDFLAVVHTVKLRIELISNFPEHPPSSNYENHYDLGNFIDVAHVFPR